MTISPAIAKSPAHAAHADRAHATRAVAAALLCALIAMALCSCGGSGSGGGGGGASSGPTVTNESDDPAIGTTTGPQYSIPAELSLSTYNDEAAVGSEDARIDVSSVAQGYVGASARSEARLKFQVIKGEMSYNYDLPSDGTPIICPLNMGDGAYSFRIMQNTSGTSYVELMTLDADVVLENEFTPFLRPNMFCDFDEDSAVVAKARELAADAQNEGEVVRAVYDWVTENISYDTEKAKELADATGYVPNPDEILETQKGICFDYASMSAAMMRSLGIPCQIITGYVAPDNIYHAWNMMYIDGSWVSSRFSIDTNSWTRVDLTFAAADGGDSSTIGDGSAYTDRYVY